MNESLLIEYFRPSYPWPSHFTPITTFDQLKYLTEWHLIIDLKYFFLSWLVPESLRKTQVLETKSFLILFFQF